MNTRRQDIAKRATRRKKSVLRKTLKREVAKEAPGMSLDPLAEKDDAMLERVMTWDEVKRRLLSRKGK